jgi:hypothetical protein
VTLSLLTAGARPDTDRLETFLLSIDGVCDASAWVRGEALLATVTLFDGFHADVAEFQELCRASLGEVNTPQMILFQHALRPAA